MKKDIHFILQDDNDQSSTGAVLHVAPIVDATTTWAPTSVDLLGYEGAEIIIAAGTWTSGTQTWTIKESDTDTSFTAVATDDLRGGTGTISISSGGTGSKAYLRGYVGNKRYLKITGAKASATGAIPVAVIVLRTHAKNRGNISNY